MRHVLQTMFLEDCINNVDIKYQTFLTASKECYYTYANIPSLSLYYNLFTFKKNADYKTFEKLHTQKHYEVIKLSTDKIKQNNYNTHHILFLYGYVCSIYLFYHLEDYINQKAKSYTKKGKMRKYSSVIKHIESQLYEERYNEKINKFKLKIKELKIEDQTFELINDILSQLFYSSNGIDIVKIGYKNFLKYQKKNFKNIKIFNQFICGLLDTFTRAKKYSAASIYNRYNSKKDYLNKENKSWIKNGEECDYSFYQIYQEALSEATKLLNLINEEIFYNAKNEKQIKLLLSRLKNKE